MLADIPPIEDVGAEVAFEIGTAHLAVHAGRDEDADAIGADAVPFEILQEQKEYSADRAPPRHVADEDTDGTLSGDAIREGCRSHGAGETLLDRRPEIGERKRVGITNGRNIAPAGEIDLELAAVVWK